MIRLFSAILSASMLVDACVNPALPGPWSWWEVLAVQALRVVLMAATAFWAHSYVRYVRAGRWR